MPAKMFSNKLRGKKHDGISKALAQGLELNSVLVDHGMVSTWRPSVRSSQTNVHCPAIRLRRIVGLMYTIIETEVFKRYAESIWDDGERHEFIAWLAVNPLVGDVVPGSGGLRKVRWSRSGMGKRGGTRVIYYNTLSEGSIWLLIAYTKAKFDNLPAAFLKQLKEEISNGQ